MVQKCGEPCSRPTTSNIFFDTGICTIFLTECNVVKLKLRSVAKCSLCGEFLLGNSGRRRPIRARATNFKLSCVTQRVIKEYLCSNVAQY